MDLVFESFFTWDEQALKEELVAGGKIQDLAQGEGLPSAPSVESQRNDTNEKSCCISVYECYMT
ncbi:hypothetical protein BDZ89DRAFT_635223 [Hymenopellis radicata]|nr:hypothetical protein BDZ89DRAFT_635223 [Hymenopellis radicata]